MECSSKGIRVCPVCKYKIEEKEAIRCPRCFTILLAKCSDCKKCKFG